MAFLFAPIAFYGAYKGASALTDVIVSIGSKAFALKDDLIAISAERTEQSHQQMISQQRFQYSEHVQQIRTKYSL